MNLATGTSSVLDPWLKPLLDGLPGLSVMDAHTHIGADVDGTVCDPAMLLASLDSLAADAVTFPLHVEHGYAVENDAVIAAAAASEGRLVPFCRLDPHTDVRSEGARAIAAGARGIKLHPRAENFALTHPGVRDAMALADEHALPVLIHAGRGIPPLGADALRLAREHPRATLILAHAAITDLAWIAGALDDCPNVLFDTSWWNPPDLLALFALISPDRILFASDMPYGLPAFSALITLRCALAVGLSSDELRSVMGGRLQLLLAGQPAPDLGPAPGAARLEYDVLLDRAKSLLLVAFGNIFAEGTDDEFLDLARMALDVSESHPHRAICEAATAALDLPPVGPRGLGGVAVALTMLSTPGVPVT